MQSKSALRDRRITNFVELRCLVASGGVDIRVSSTTFQKSNIGCPQQPPTEKVLKSVKIWIFDDPFHKNDIWLGKKPVRLLGFSNRNKRT